MMTLVVNDINGGQWTIEDCIYKYHPESNTIYIYNKSDKTLHSIFNIDKVVCIQYIEEDE